VLAAFDAAAEAFLANVRQVEHWEAPGLGEWTVRELVAHTLRAFTTIETYLDAPLASDAAQVDATEYHRIGMSLPNVHTGVAERGRQAARTLSDPVGQSDEIAARVVALARVTPPDRPIQVISGRMVFTDYLATRTVELGLHTLDIQHALGAPPLLPGGATELCLDVLLGLPDPIELLLAITGRRTLNVLG